MSTPLRVLMVEDSEDSCLLITGELEKKGYASRWQRVESSAAMRQAFTDDTWDVVIADFVVPEFNAFASLKVAQELAPDLPFIVVSGNLGEDLAVAVMKAGAHDYVTKGNLTRLVPAIERELREAETRRARRQAEDALKQKEALSRAVLDSLSASIAVLTRDGTIVATNANWDACRSESALAASWHPAGTTNYLDVFRPGGGFPSAEKALAGILSVLEGACPSFALEYSLPWNTNTRWFLLHATPLINYGGAVVSHLDLTGMKQAEEALSQAREALRKSQASLLLAQRIGHVGSWEYDVATQTMEWSAETYRIFDQAPEGGRPTLRQFLNLLADEDRPIVSQGFEKALQERSSYRADCRIFRPDGSSRFVHLQAQLILDATDKPVQMIGTIQDITDRKMLEEQVRHSQKMDAVGQLAGGIAHDFNNILTVIQGYTELISYAPQLDQQTRSYASQISVSAERASKLTRQLLAFSRKQLMQLKPLDINQLLENLSPMLQRLLGEQTNLHMNLEGDLPSVPADAGMMEQILVNLAMNARDAMPKGGRLIIETALHEIDPEYCRIHLEALPGNFICLSVIDTGCGMDSKTLDHIFEPFFTTKEFGRGTGLGLPTVYGIVKQHQGWIQVASEVGQGTAFKVFLPVGDAGLGRANNQAQRMVGSRKPDTILLVEDEPPLRQLAKSILERDGYRVVEAASGPEALSVWKDFSNRIDMLLTDMVMPGGMTGRELARRLQAQNPSLKVLYTSGYSLDFVESDLLLREGVNFLAKPYGATSLTQAVHACLETKS